MNNYVAMATAALQLLLAWLTSLLNIGIGIGLVSGHLDAGYIPLWVATYGTSGWLYFLALHPIAKHLITKFNALGTEEKSWAE